MIDELKNVSFMKIIKQGVSPAVTNYYREQYRKNGHVLIENFFDPFLAKHFCAYVTEQNIEDFFKAQAGDDYVSIDYSFAPNFIKEYHFLINQKNYIDFLQSVTGVERIGLMKGHIHISDNSKKRGYGFHSDNDGNRYFLCSINISPDIYEGGVFTMRNSKTQQHLFSVQNNKSYGLLIAPISDDLEHAVSSVTGEQRRYTLLSWAMIEPKLQALTNF